MLEFIGTVVGLVYLWLEYRTSIYLWVAGIVMPVIYIFVYYEAGLYADFGINVYYLLAAVYGWVLWKRGGRSREQTEAVESETNGIQRIFSHPSPLGWGKGAMLIGATLFVFLFIAWILIRFTDSNVPWLDSFTTALSMVGMWMLAKKFVEQWWVWMVVDVVSAGLYVYKELYFTASLYLLYALIAYFGYRKWLQMMEEDRTYDNRYCAEKRESWLHLGKARASLALRSVCASFDAVVLADGDYPTAGIPRNILASAPYVACCDGAANAYISQGHVPDLIVGDGDSLSAENRRRYGHLLHRIAEQETNDLTKTVSLLAQQGKKHIAILGATGKREDHTLGNISLLIEYLREGLDVRMYTDYGVFIPCRNSVSLNTFPGQKVSIFSFGTEGMRGEGLRYPIRDFSSWWQGTLNESESDAVTIHAMGGYLVFLGY